MKSLYKKLIIVCFSLFLLLGGITGIWSYDKYWCVIDSSELKHLTVYQSGNISGSNFKNIYLHKSFIKNMIELDSMLEKNGLEMRVNQGYRHKRHRLLGAVVSPSSVSNHLAGEALDFYLVGKEKNYYHKDLKRENYSQLPKEVKQFFNDIRNSALLRWGGDFKREDPIHIDFPLNQRNRKLYHQQAKLCFQDYENAIYTYDKVWNQLKSKF
ncbi:M15 family metallopeptidase [Flammeovirga sp. SubArs3]|uniref:M15 family metallopeptidase n=1 Tax=Flammeovirga sp. SubArs3 TaxID=2995316 RepID=UPI00248AA986|nr:M15 family metallopeptidase [Flammeovirga sp. SubArs3]